MVFIYCVCDGNATAAAAEYQCCYPNYRNPNPKTFSGTFNTLMPSFSNVRYRFYSDIDQLTSVLALHEREIAHPFDKVFAKLEDRDRRDIYSVS